MTARYLSINECAERLGITPHTIATYGRQGRLPAPDAIIGAGTRAKRGWLPGTIDAWNASRPGHGGRPPKTKATS